MAVSATDLRLREPDAHVAKQFAELAETWRAETAYLSSTTELVNHPAYQQIINLGLGVVPLILTDLHRQPDQWFTALKRITGEDPVLPKHRGRLALMADDWLRWGRLHGWE